MFDFSRPVSISAILVITAVPVAAVDFAKDVFPVLQRACFECHGPDKQKGGLRLDARDSVLQGGKGQVVVAGRPDASDLLRRISLPRADGDAMPKRGDLLKPAEIDSIRAWIASGAVWPEHVQSIKHWAYVPPRNPSLPMVKDQKWVRTGIDRFILARLEKEGLTPSPEAEAAVLIRRLSLDLTGLPPSPELLRRYISRSGTGHMSEPVWEALVDELLKSPEFGVKWARHWLDLARYADSHGFQRDDLREIWPFRDWVVKALNADMPFDQFTIEQVAGDLLPGATRDQIVATGFHRCTPTNVEAGTEPEESRINQVIDRVNTTGAVWLGTTLECAQCHNHKYDPFTMRDYYGLLACFNNTEKEAERTNPGVPGSIQFKGSSLELKDPSKEAERARLTADLTVISEKIKNREKQLSGSKSRLPSSSADGTSDVTPLVPTAFLAESGAEFEVLDDTSVLLKGDPEAEDAYTFEAELPPGEISGLKLEALAHPSLPGEGPGRGHADRPNFVLQGFDVLAKLPGQKSPLPLKFSRAFASFSQKAFDVTNLITGQGNGSWAINPQFHQSHWAVFSLAQPVTVPAGTKLTVVLPQRYGAARTIGCLRLSVIRGDVAASLPPPAVEVAKPVESVPSRKKRRGDISAPAISSDPELAGLQRQMAALQKKLSVLKAPTSEVMREMPQPRMTTIFKRGEYTQPGDQVAASTPAVIDVKADGPVNRLALARWLVNRKNPLTARVVVNRWWAEIFGRGIVGTVEDFGIKGDPPTHLELLDWLAVGLMENGWSMKHVIREIVTSSVYRQASNARKPASDVDPANTLLWRGPRFRMDAEMIRDNALSIAGLLSLEKGGPSIRPPQPDGLWKKVGGQDYKYEESTGESKYRRGIYVVLKRGSPYPGFMNFDASQRMACVVKRSRSNTPLQALTLLNDSVHVEAARAFAGRITSLSGHSTTQRIIDAFRIALARTPSELETAVLLRLFDQQLAATKKPAEAWYAVASAILNLDECITKG